MEEPKNISKTVFVLVLDLRRKLALWVLNKEDIVKNEDGTVKFIKPEGWGLPGGGVEEEDKKYDKDGFDLAEINAARREVPEETGFEIKLDKYDFRLDPEERDDHQIITFATTNKFTGEIHKSSIGEIKQVDWFPIYNPPKNAYKGHLRRYWKIINALKEMEALA